MIVCGGIYQIFIKLMKPGGVGAIKYKSNFHQFSFSLNPMQM